MSGGDLYYLSACNHGVIARVVVADVAGHGETVSAAAVRLRDALRVHVDEWDQSLLIRQLNDSFLETAQDGRYATAFLASYCSTTGELLFTNAGHLPPLWYRAACGRWSLLHDQTPYSKSIEGLPLGLIAGTAYDQTAVDLKAGDLLVLYTDGISESWNESGEQLGLDGLLSIARTLPTTSPAEVGEALLAAIEDFRGGVPAADDETVIALQSLASAV
jgi:sigma-B regulation protein RsbU (phosphoserine phosphatase)